MTKLMQLFCLLLLCTSLTAQQYRDFIGAGHNNGITVTTSHNQNTSNTGDKSVDGFPVDDPDALADASRFLAQATLGADFETIQMVAAMGYEAWIDEQFSLPLPSVLNQMYLVQQAFEDGEEDEGNALFRHYFQSAWWQNLLTQPDALRQRVNLALSEIFVISLFGSDLFEDFSQVAGNYYDILGAHSFGNYRNLIEDVTKNPGMGLYLSHFNNPKSDPANNIHPDENYAREVMQLFSIGLYELNNDGTRKTNPDGSFIPTYNNDDIREFAKIFTGFGDGTPSGEFGAAESADELGALTTPMKMYDEWHEPGPKYLLNGQVVPAGQTGLQDVSDALDNLHNHPNTGPFLGKALIQFLVTSNPSPAYVDRVADAFNNNGNGERGDFKAVIKAILLDPEARDCNASNNPTGGKLREPLVRYANLLKSFNAYPTAATFYTTMDRFQSATGQTAMYSPSVFNFFQPEFQPNGAIADADLVGPVFQIHNSSTAIGYVNELNHWAFNHKYMDPFAPEFDDDDFEDYGENYALIDLSDELAIAEDATELVNRLNIIMAAGQLSPAAQTIIEDAVSQVVTPQEKVDMAMYLIGLSPDYAFIK